MEEAPGAEPSVRWVGGVAFRPDGAQLAAAGTHETLALWSFRAGTVERNLRTPIGSAFALTYNHNGTRLAFAGSDRSVWIFDLKPGGEPLVISDHREGIASVAFSRDENVIATGGGDPPEVVQEPMGKFSPIEHSERTIRLWDAATGIAKQSLRGHVGSIHAIGFGPREGQLVSAGADGAVRVWNIETGEPVLDDEGAFEPAL